MGGPLLVVDAIHSVVLRLVLAAGVTQLVLAPAFLISQMPFTQLDQFVGLTAAEVASLCAYSHYLSLSVVVTELTVFGWGRRLRRASFFVVLLVYHFGWSHYLHSINTIGRFSCLGVLGKAIVVLPVVAFVPMFGNILLCFLTAFLGN